MIILKIDGKQVEIDQGINPAITVAIANIKVPENSSSGYSKSVEIPFTPTNLSVFGYANELYNKDRFNNERHTAEYQNDETVIMRGIAQIEKIAYKTGRNGQITGGAFHVSVIGAAYEWISAAKKRINELESSEGVKYTMDDVYTSSIQTTPSLVKFFPVDRGAFWEEIAEVITPRKMLDIKDYHPFVNIWILMKVIFGGWSLKSSMAEYLEKLYYSGYMPVNEDLSYIKEENDFYIGRKPDAQTECYTNDVVDIFDNHNDEEAGYFSNGVIQSPLSAGARYTRYTPNNTLTAKYVIDVSFTAKISTSNFLPVYYADTLFFGMVDKFSFPVEKSLEYKDMTTDPDDIRQAGRYLFKMEIPESIANVYTGITFVETNATISTGFGATKGEWVPYTHKQGPLQILLKNNQTADINIKTVKEIKFSALLMSDSCLTFQETIYTNPYTITGANTNHFGCKFQCDGSPTNNKHRVNLGEYWTLKPDIGNYIGWGDNVGISTIGGTGTQLEFLAAIRQMFNLMFYTNPQTKEVIIEPRKSFYNLDRADIVDWYDKIDYSKEIVVEDVGEDVGNEFKLSYADGNEVVKRYNWKNSMELGSWKTPLLNKSSNESKEVANSLFTPFLLRTVESMGMTIPQDKPEKTQEQIQDIDLDITPIIGYFDHVATRMAGNDRTTYPKYPRLVFQDAAKGVNLGFGDLNTTPSISGLNHYYQDNISVYNHGRRITLYLYLTNQDVEDMQFPTDQMRDLRAVFLLRLDGEDVPCVLESISDYNPQNGSSTKCQFVVDANIKLTGGERVVIKRDGVVVLRKGVAMVELGRLHPTTAG